MVLKRVTNSEEGEGVSHVEFWWQSITGRGNSWWKGYNYPYHMELYNYFWLEYMHIQILYYAKLGLIWGEGLFSSPCGRWFHMVFCKHGKEDKVLQKTLTVACNTDSLSSPCTLRLKNHLEDAEADTVFSLLQHFLSLN